MFAAQRNNQCPLFLLDEYHASVMPIGTDIHVRRMRIDVANDNIHATTLRSIMRVFQSDKQVYELEKSMSKVTRTTESKQMGRIAFGIVEETYRDLRAALKIPGMNAEITAQPRAVKVSPEEFICLHTNKRLLSLIFATSDSDRNANTVFVQSPESLPTKSE